ncbi:sulfatase [Marinovum sp. 2_MG-2023]|uniref:sulfatase family protein n=1 Tax=unclassified Marinovum TaxID=2647166 RepID=UPI0026E31AF9|nr:MULTISPECIES: sulfatase [unclassified Marinovum]MDO6732561.1 sulfatase [Marinovum sp. 2_MG-2023]MDO6781807.1 sulfatase [Marinovum sp. 1_MG-2023]
MTDSQKRAPNILFIMCDDHAAQAIGAYGSRLNETPNIDRIAKDGVRLNNCFVTNSICTPSRAAILTGQHNHINGVTTLDTPFDTRRPHLGKHLQQAGYRTAMIGKWHLGEGPDHEPTGFDHWSVLPGQGDYFDPEFIGPKGRAREPGYVTDLITDKCLDWMKQDDDRPFFLMCHHKAPHRNFAPHPKNRELYTDIDIPVPDSFDDDYATRSQAAKEARMRVRNDFEYEDLGLAQPEGGAEVGEIHFEGKPGRKVPHPDDPTGLRLIDTNTGEVFTFDSERELALFKYRRYIQRYLQCVASVDESVGRLLDHLEATGQAENTIVIYTSDQGFFLGEHGWFDKRFMYEESLRMPFLIRYPNGLAAAERDEMICNVDFAPTLLDFAGAKVPSYMQGRSFRPCLEGTTPEDWPDAVYHRYWMHRDNSHQAFAHYGLRNQRYKIIHWYNDGLGHLGTGEKTDPPEWELFDLESDPSELVNLWDAPEHGEVRDRMLAALENRMQEIGDIPEHR